MKDTIKTHVQKTKNYLTSHTHVVTAAAAVVGVVLLHQQNRSLKKVVYSTNKTHRMLVEENNLNHERGNAITECKREGRDFDFYPGVGVWVHPLKKDPK